MGHQLTGLRLPKTLFDLGDEAQPLNGVLNCCLFRQGLEGLNSTLLLCGFHVQDSTIVSRSFFRCQPNVRAQPPARTIPSARVG